ncbi:MAG: undecaprenyl/decaprenyl-phosphate alpha-N-acetylglucosaminyl 1-phosphate transferase [Tannerella sp.]|nr:undecaprenyl/decaprenyl-phosphate alpha-N-acetylglucosaminyl 1-phosphate transferase [Tannerella sp.]
MSYLCVFLSFFSSLFLALLIIPKILFIAVKHSLFDTVNDRKIHAGNVPRIGGVSFIPCILVSITFVLGIYYMNTDFNLGDLYFNNSEFYLLICALLLLYIGGIKDDLVGLRHYYKFYLQVISSVIIVFSGLFINNLYGFLGIWTISPFVGIPLTVFIIIFIINSINFIDGMDGLASGLSIFALCVYGTLFMFHDLWFYTMLAFSTIGVLIPFFCYNVFGNAKRHNKLFMGDSGSLTLGLILAFLAIRYCRHIPSNFEPFNNIVVIAFSPIIIPILDITNVIFIRLVSKKNLFVADNNHIHHKLLNLGLSKSVSLMLLLLLNGAICLFNFIIMKYLNGAIILLIDFILWAAINYYILIKRKKNVVNQ